MSAEYDLKNFVDCGGCRPMRITPYEICIILHIIWNPNPIIVLSSIQYSSYLKNMPTSMNVKFLSSTSSQGPQLPSPFLAISYAIDVILLDIANVFQIWSALAGFKEIAVAFESFSFCSIETTVI